jgi:uncharacterized damage-inducible protein DinB
MDEKALFLKFWEREAPAMRKVIERVPEGSDYKPDPKSRSAKDIAWQIVREEIVLGEGLAQGFLDWKDIPAPATMNEVLTAYDRDHAAATKKMQSLPLEGWTRQVPFKYEGKEFSRSTGFEHAWGFFFDLIHHRGQLTTYLRPMGAKVPQIYGPSADEP